MCEFRGTGVSMFISPLPSLILKLSFSVYNRPLALVHSPLIALLSVPPIVNSYVSGGGVCVLVYNGFKTAVIDMVCTG